MISSKNQRIIMDLSLLAFITVVLLTAIFMAIGPNSFFFNLICLMITFILVIITYFTNIVTGLIFNLLFFFGQLVYVFYVSVYKSGFTLAYVFWLIIPPVLCLLIFGITLHIQQLSQENVQLQSSNARLNALDQETKLRTLNMFDEDYSVLSKASEGSADSLKLMVIRIRYWEGLKSRLNDEQTKVMIHLITEQVNAYFSKENFKYIIDQHVPTWGILSFYELSEMRLIRIRIKEDFQDQLRVSNALAGVTIELVISITINEEGEEQTSTKLLADGVKELQYDV